MTSLRRMMISALASIGLAPLLLGAQRAPQQPASDTAPALRTPVQPGLRPSQTAARGRTATAKSSVDRATSNAAATDAAARAPRVVGSTPLDSIRPKTAMLQAPSSKDVPPSYTPPPAPETRANVASPVAVRAMLLEDQPPANATARCKDGTFLTTPVDDNSCRDHAGLAASFPQRQPSPPRPRP